jgi:phosphoribosylformylglycinamidine cyclo-ligase
MPGMYEGSDYDLAGFCVGVVEKDAILDGSSVRPGDSLIALASSGPHSNGYSLIRKVIEVSNADLEQRVGDVSLADALMAPTEIYVKPLLSLLRAGRGVHALAHITGGGLLENVPRVLPDGCRAHIDTASWDWPPVFRWLQEAGNIDTREMYRTFNCGIGMLICVAADEETDVLEALRADGLTAWRAGHISEGEPGVDLAE